MTVDRSAGRLTFRPLREDDLPLFVGWLAEPHVDAWWHERLDLDGVRRKYVPRIRGEEPTRVYVLETDRPIGWIQGYRWRDYPLHAAQLGAGPSEAGLDLAIGEPEWTGRGWGTVAITRFVDEILLADGSVDGCFVDIDGCLVDVDVRNVRSIRAFEKAGFVAAEVVDVAEQGLRRLMRRRR